MTNVLSKTLTLTLGLCAALASSAAQSSDVQRYVQSNAADLCQPALPAYDGLIRKRPRAVLNEGETTAFVTCAYTFNWTAESQVSWFTLSVFNTKPFAQPITCTAVFGTEGQTGVPANSTKTFNSQGVRVLVWGSADFGGGLLPARTAVSLSCQLSPGTGITYGSGAVLENIGL